MKINHDNCDYENHFFKIMIVNNHYEYKHVNFVFLIISIVCDLSEIQFVSGRPKKQSLPWLKVYKHIYKESKKRPI